MTQKTTSLTKIQDQARLISQVEGATIAKLDLAKIAPVAQKGTFAASLQKSMQPQPDFASKILGFQRDAEALGPLAASIQKAFKPDLATTLQGIKPDPRASLAAMIANNKKFKIDPLLDPKTKLVATVAAHNAAKLQGIQARPDLATMLRGIQMPPLAERDSAAPGIVLPEVREESDSTDPPSVAATQEGAEPLFVVEGEQAEAINSILEMDEERKEGFSFTQLIAGWQLDYLLLSCVGVSTWVISTSVEKSGHLSLGQLAATLWMILAIRDSLKKD